MAKEDKKPTCETCKHFDNSKHKNDKRTQHAGICNRWSQVQFLTDNCNQHFDLSNPDTWEQLIAPKQEFQQQSLF